MVQIIFVSHARDSIQNAVLWQVYHQLAPPAANPHSFWLRGRQYEERNEPQPIVFAEHNRPATFKALLSIQDRRVGVLCCTQRLDILLNAINMNALGGNSIIVCGVTDRRIIAMLECLLANGFGNGNYAQPEIINLDNLIPNHAQIDPNALRDGIQFYDIAQDIANHVIQLINQNN